MLGRYRAAAARRKPVYGRILTRAGETECGGDKYQSLTPLPMHESLATRMQVKPAHVKLVYLELGRARRSIARNAAGFFSPTP